MTISELKQTFTVTKTLADPVTRGNHAPKRPTKFLYCKKNRFYDKLADSSGSDNVKRRSSSDNAKSVHLQGALDQRFCPWTPLGVLPPDSCYAYRFVLHAHHVAPKTLALDLPIHKAI